MDFEIRSHRMGWEIVNAVPQLAVLWDDLTNAIESLTDEALITEFERQQGLSDKPQDEVDENKGSKMSLSSSINVLLDEALKRDGWQAQSALFQGEQYKSGTRWRLDFSKQMKLETRADDFSAESVTGMAVEVAFNHGEAIAWNLLKPVIAAELNHVAKETFIGSGVGVIICATEALKKAGGFDSAVGNYEKFLRYLDPMRNQLTVPMLIVGLKPPKTFVVKKVKDEVTKKNRGVIVRLSA